MRVIPLAVMVSAVPIVSEKLGTPKVAAVTLPPLTVQVPVMPPVKDALKLNPGNNVADGVEIVTVPVPLLTLKVRVTWPPKLRKLPTVAELTVRVSLSVPLVAPANCLSIN